MNRLHVILFFLLFSTFKINAQENEGYVVSVLGKGQTTGHIADLIYRNNTDLTLKIKAQDFYLPSDGKYQSYVGHIPEGISIPPQTQITINIEGYCTDVTKPPIPSEHSLPPVSQWIPVLSNTDPNEVSEAINQLSFQVAVIPTKPLPAFSEDDIPLIVNSPAYEKTKVELNDDYDITYPGTNISIGGTLDADEDPTLVAPLLVEMVRSIEHAAVIILDQEAYPTPFSNSPTKEMQSVVQQTVWMTTASPFGLGEYEKDEFSEKVNEQFEATNGVSINALAEEKQEQLKIGIEDFWNAFVATGVEAKVLKSKDTEELQPEPNLMTTEVKTSTCSLDSLIEDSGKDLDYAIAPTGTEEANEEIMKSFASAIEEAAGIVNATRDVDSIDIAFTTPELPASVWSLYFPHTVAGRANASAFIVDLNNPHKSAWTTEPIKSKAKGEHKVVLTHHAGKDCTSTLYGINIAKVKASSSIKEQLTSIEELKVVNFVGEVAIDYLLKRGKGKAKKLGKYLKEKVKDLAKSKAKESIKEELKKIGEMIEGKTDKEADEIIEELTKNIKSGEEEEEESDFLEDWLAELIIEGDKIKPGEKIISDQIDKIDSPIDWAPIKTNTYAMVEGNIKVFVEDDKDHAKASSAVRYKRKEMEASEEAISGGGIFVEEALASKSTTGSITLITQGKSESYAGATGEGIISTGHGAAEAVLESFNAMYVVALCECPHYSWHDYFYSATIYTENERMSAIWTKMFETIMNKVMKDYEKDGDKSKIKEKLEKEATRATSIIMRNN